MRQINNGPADKLLRVASETEQTCQRGARRIVTEDHQAITAQQVLHGIPGR